MIVEMPGHKADLILRDAARTGAAPQNKVHDILTTSRDQLEIFTACPND
jgi:hypothetical protein